VASYVFSFFFFSSRRRHTRFSRDWSSDVCSSDLVEPEQDRPQAVLFAHVIGTGAEAFFATERHLASVQQIAEEFPARWRLVAADPQPFGHAVGGSAGGHGACDACNAICVTRRKRGVRSQNRQAVRWGDEH